MTLSSCIILSEYDIVTQEIRLLYIVFFLFFCNKDDVNKFIKLSVRVGILYIVYSFFSTIASRAALTKVHFSPYLKKQIMLKFVSAGETCLRSNFLNT